MITTAEIAQIGSNLLHDDHTLEQVTEEIRNRVPAQTPEGIESQTRHALAYMFRLLVEEYSKE